MRQRPIGHPNQRRPVPRVLLTLWAATLALGLMPAISSAAATCQGQDVTIDGADGNNNVLNGTPGRDVIAGLGGDDTIDGLQGKDIICGGGGSDTIYGSDGNDTLLGQDGDDYLYGDTGATSVANDVMDGGPNTPYGGDWVYFIGSYSTGGGTGVTVNLEGGTAVGEGQDTLKNLENVYGSEYDDTLIGDDSPNYLAGGEGAGEDVIWGRDGNDIAFGQAGDDQMFGGGGVWDWVVYFYAPTSVVLDLDERKATIGTETDELSGFELVVGSDNNDTLRGDARTNYLAGGGGNDNLDGRDGYDIGTFYNSVNANLNTGFSTTGTSSDPLVLPEGTDSLVNLEGLWGSPAVDNLVGDSGNNLFRGGADNDSLSGLGGDDYFLQEGGSDIVNGGNDTYDLIDYTLAPNGVEVNLDTESDGVGGTVTQIESLLGSAYNDVLRGDSGTNYLYGQAGNDNLRGKGGDDALAGGKGNDNVSGGPGNDRCIQGEIQLTCELAKPPPPHPLFVVGSTVARAERRYK